MTAPSMEKIHVISYVFWSHFPLDSTLKLQETKNGINNEGVSLGTYKELPKKEFCVSHARQMFCRVVSWSRKAPMKNWGIKEGSIRDTLLPAKIYCFLKEAKSIWWTGENKNKESDVSWKLWVLIIGVVFRGPCLEESCLLSWALSLLVLWNINGVSRLGLFPWSRLYTFLWHQGVFLNEGFFSSTHLSSKGHKVQDRCLIMVILCLTFWATAKLFPNQ